jgi:hypothetical protein
LHLYFNLLELSSWRWPMESACDVAESASAS